MIYLVKDLLNILKVKLTKSSPNTYVLVSLSLIGSPGMLKYQLQSLQDI